MECECVCKICGETSKVEHYCESTPSDMTWCKGGSHPEYSKLIHWECGYTVTDKYGEIRLYCKECRNHSLSEKIKTLNFRVQNR